MATSAHLAPPLGGSPRVAIARTAIGRFFQGAFYLLRGARVLWRIRHEVGGALAVPLFLAGIASLLGAVEVVRRVHGWFGAAARHHSLGQLAVGLGGAFLLVAVVASGWLFTAVYLVLSGPMNDRISERVEGTRLGERAPRGTFLGLLRDVLHDVPRLAAYLVSLGLVWCASLAYAPIFPAGSFVLTAGYFAYNAIDYSMARRGLGRREKTRRLRRRRALVYGLGAAETALALVPGLNLLVPPLGAAAGTLLFLDHLDEEATVAAGNAAQLSN